MRCTEFQNNVTDWVRLRLSADDSEMLRHARSCGACSTRLREEQALELAITGLREAYASEETSPVIEQRLLAQLRGCRDHADSRSRSTGASARRAALYVKLAAAAVVLLCCGLAVWFAYPRPDGRAPVEQADSSRVPLMADQATARVPETPKAMTVAPAVEASSTPMSTAASVERARNRRVERRPVAPPDQPSAAAPNGQTTPFIPTMLPFETESDYGLQLVRMELPRSTMTSFGFRVDRQHLNRPVKADLLIGPDGLTRAIRFVP